MERVSARRKAIGGLIKMQFLLGVVLFVVLIGAMDARLPWPAAKKERGHS